MSENHTLAKEGGSEREQGEESVDSSVKKNRFQGGEGDQEKRGFPGEVEGSKNWVSGRESSPERPAESSFHSKSGQT